MDTSKVGVGGMIAAISALALFVFMFLPWYDIESVGGFGVGDFGGSANAWEAFSFIDILLFLISVLVVGLVLAVAAGSTPELPQPPGQIIAIAGAVAVVLILFRLIFTPGLDTGGLDVDVDVGRKIGVFLGLIAAAGIAYGGWRATEETAGGDGVATASAPPPPPPPPEPPAQEPPSGGSTPPSGDPLTGPPAQEPPAEPAPEEPGRDDPPREDRY